MAFWSRRHDMGWASLLMGVSILFSRFIGLGRDKIISYLFGATRESDLYFAAFVIPDFINYLLAGAYFSITLIPLLFTYFERGEEEGWKFFSTVFLWVSVGITILTAAAMWFAPQLAHLTSPGLDRAAQLRLAFFLRIILPAQIFFLIGSCLNAVLYWRKQFVVGALMPLLYNAAIIAGGIVLRQRGMEGFCWGVLLGAFAGNFLLPFLAVRFGGGLKLTFSPYHPGLKRFIVLALPLMLGQSIVVLDEQLVRVFGSLVGTGAISWLNYARRIMLVPVGVVAQAAGVASYPFLAELISKRDFTQFDRTLNTALRNTLVLLIPLSLWMVTAAEPITRLIFQQGHFSAADTAATAGLLRIFLAAVSLWGIQQIVGRGFYARQDTITPVILGTLTTLVSIALFYYLAHFMKTKGVAVASALSMAVYTAALSAWWSRRFGRGVFSGLGRSILQVLSIALAASVPAFAIVTYGFTGWANHPLVSAAAAIGFSGIAFVVTFSVLAMRFIPSLVRPFFNRGAIVMTKLVGWPRPNGGLFRS